MSKTFLKHWALAFIVTVLIDVLWHRVILGSWYGANDPIARVSGGLLAPLIQYILLADVLFSGALVSLVGMASSVNKKFVWNGAFLGLVVVGYFSLCGYALIPNWS